MYCSVLLYFFARYLAEALLGILTKDSSLLYLVMLHGVSHTQKSLSCSTKKSGGKGDMAQPDLWISSWTDRFAGRVCGWTGETHAVKCNKWWGLPHSGGEKLILNTNLALTHLLTFSHFVMSQEQSSMCFSRIYYFM